MAKCKICGKQTARGHWYLIEPSEKLPEIKKEMKFCSQECAEKFLKRIVAARKRDLMAVVRADIENTDRKFCEGDIDVIFATLTQTEKRALIGIGLGVLLAKDDYLPNFYKNLKKACERR